MAELPILPLATDALLADTSHMSAEQFGAYVRLLLVAWRHGARLRNDPAELAQIAGVSPEHWREIAPVVLRPMTIAEGTISQKRLTKTFADVRELRRKRALAGQRGAAGRWKRRGMR